MRNQSRKNLILGEKEQRHSAHFIPPAFTGRSVPQNGNNDMTVFSDEKSKVPFEGLYIISVAARLLAMHPQTLRKYERAGLINPTRTVGMLRLYSEEDIVRLRLIKHLVGEMGLNLAGVEVALAMFNQMLRIKSGLDQAKEGELKDYLENCLDEMFKILK